MTEKINLARTMIETTFLIIIILLKKPKFSQSSHNYTSPLLNYPGILLFFQFQPVTSVHISPLEVKHLKIRDENVMLQLSLERNFQPIFSRNERIMLERSEGKIFLQYPE